jgi:hypothetical protein
MTVHFHNIMQRLEGILREKNNKEKILNKEIATELGLTPDYYAVIKKRGKVPYLSLALFAQKEKINLNWLLLGSPPKRLCDTSTIPT